VCDPRIQQRHRDQGHAPDERLWKQSGIDVFPRIQPGDHKHAYQRDDIRDGENLSISWLDPDKIMLSEEDLFYSAKTGVTSPADISEKRSSTREDILSRWFFFNILQGVLDRGVLLRVPEKVSVTEVNSPYITFSAADAWLYDDRYGSFSDLLKKSSHIPLKKGDMILTGTKISREYTSTVHDSWDNERGIGEKNRTRGKSLPAIEIMPVNKVLPSVKAEYTIRTYTAVIKESMVPWYRSQMVMKDQHINMMDGTMTVTSHHIARSHRRKQYPKEKRKRSSLRTSGMAIRSL